MGVLAAACLLTAGATEPVTAAPVAAIQEQIQPQSSVSFAGIASASVSASGSAGPDSNSSSQQPTQTPYRDAVASEVVEIPFTTRRVR
jgi:hypothetical protein